MTRDARITCFVCAWRATCQLKFSMTNAQHCPEFTRDVSLKDTEEQTSKPEADEESKETDQ